MASIQDAMALVPEARLRYVGCFPCEYSANWVVQDNRKGAMKSDWALVFVRSDCPESHLHSEGLSELPGWTESPPDILAGAS